MSTNGPEASEPRWLDDGQRAAWVRLIRGSLIVAANWVADKYAQRRRRLVHGGTIEDTSN